MEKSKHYRRLTKQGQAIIQAFKKNRNHNDLMNGINTIINKQNTINARASARSNFRGLLRVHFKFTNMDLLPIQTSDDEKQRYFNILKDAQEKKTEDILDNEILEKLLKIDILNLLIRSGLRISELLENKFKISKDGIKFQLNKKKNEHKDEYHNIMIIGDFKQWKKDFERVREEVKDKRPKQIYDKLNRKMKTIIPKDFTKKSTHICRAIYVKMIYKFKDGTYFKDWTLPRIIQTFLHHDNLNTSGFYQGINFKDDIKTLF